MSCLRWSLMWLAWASLAAGEVAPAHLPPVPRPLAMSGASLEEVDNALIRLARGDTSAVEALPLSAFLDPVARPDTRSDSLARRWTLALPAALARLDATARSHALTRLDARYQTLAATRPVEERARLASAFLPAPAAVADLQLATNRAFDLGHFSEYLGLAQLLASDRGTIGDDRRQQVALQLSGLGPQVDASLRLPPPGTPLPTTAQPRENSGHLAVRWQVVPGWVLALDPFAQVVWQYRVDRQAQVTTGPGAVLVRDSSGLRALDEQGTILVLPPLPTGAAVLAVAGGAAWFATGERAWRLGLTDRMIQALALDAPPLGAPLVRGSQSLWLTARELLLFDGDRLLHRFQHQLPAGAGWQLGVDGERPLIISPEQRTWRLESFTDQLLRLDGLAKAELLLQARRADDALLALGEPQSDAARRLTLRAHLSKGPAHIASLAAAPMAWCTNAQDRALLQLARLWATDSSGAWLHLFTQGGAAPLLKELDQLTSATPVLWLTASAEVLGDDPSTWDQAFSGAAWSRWRATVAAPTVGNRLTPVEDTAIAAPAAPIVERRSDGALMLDDLIIRLERGIEVISVNCQNRNGEVLWRQRWRPAAFLAAPSQTIDVRDGLVLVVEGGLRLSAFALAHGVRRAAFTLDDFGAGTPYVIGDHLAVIGPLGVDTSVTLIDARGMTRTIPLSNPARWAVPLGTSLLIASQDGSALLMPQGTAVQLPSELLRSRQAPQATPNGLLLGQRLWRWLR